ncbi:MAG: prolipoprotein diacylglyceryl transferase [Prevotella sp.]|jgi:prolipoprotein diacylglyceryl transferase|nr:prolipoprotein diacylglyceryl transferase [Prevotella sp.]MEE3385407.1 prolipoprotein diacylglyceryl transferase [Prevotella sp.]
MTEILSYITWNPDAEMIRIGGFAVRWYSMCWLVGLALAYFLVRKLYKEQKVKDGLFDPLFIYCFIGILLGARLGHCIFYEPEYWLSSPQHVFEIFVPIRFMPDGSWKFTGYEGLASHGGTIGLTVALIIYWLRVRKHGLGIWQILDNIAIATPITACFIRLGNLVNSEIIGKVTDVPWAFIFERVDMSPRHPGQLYEAIAYAIFFPIGWYLYRKHPERVGTGFFFGLCLVLIFTFRFFIEYTKDIQVAKEAAMTLNIGQMLSIPFVLIGLYCMWRSFKTVKK